MSKDWTGVKKRKAVGVDRLSLNVQLLAIGGNENS